MEKTLKEFVPGESGKVISVMADKAVRRRLFDMGLTPGASVTLLKFAPLGDPIELNVRGYRLSIRKAEASQIKMDSEKGVCQA